ncbi:HNH endonuclease [Undibacterium sp. TC9W]|uniref:HNH endonuclease n=1 Tax=Undibacterium sp. TC9W TaxID=3413053 RepID=UPI003BF3FA9A
MRYLGSPHDDGKAVFNAIYAAKRNLTKDHLYEISASVFESYENYLKHTSNLTALTAITLTTPQTEALIHAFDVPTKPLSELCENFIGSCAVCPFCQLDQTASLDHYLPKRKFPEFSVFPQNLVPCCFTCNNKKNDLVTGQSNNTPLFLHPYFDQVHDETFLTLSIKIIDDALLLKFYINKTDNMTHEDFTRISTHFEILQLRNRYRTMALDLLRGIRFGLEKRFATEEKEIAVSKYLKEEASSIACSHGRNYWKTVLFSTLANNASFCDGGFTVIPM